MRPRTRNAGLVVVGAILALAVAAVVIRPEPDRSCTRRGLKLDSPPGKLVVVRRDLPDDGSIEDRARYYACESASGRRVELDEVQSYAGDLYQTAIFTVVADRWVVQDVEDEGPEGTTEFVILRDGRTGDWLHGSDSCDAEMTSYKVLRSGHLAVACDRLLLYAPVDGPGQKLAPPGAHVRGLRLDPDGRTLRWTEKRGGRKIARQFRVV